MTKLLRQAVMPAGRKPLIRSHASAARAPVNKAMQIPRHLRLNPRRGPSSPAIQSALPTNPAAGFGTAMGVAAVAGGTIGGLYGGDGFSVSGALGGAALGAAMGFGATALGGGMMAEVAKDFGSLNKQFGRETAGNIRHLSHGLNSAEGRAMTAATGGALGGIMVTSGKSRNRKRGFNANRGSSIY